jgi:hypothetical protein
MEQAEVSTVPERAKQETEATGGERRKLWWAEASIWTDRMVSALESGVRGGKWFSLVDKIHPASDPGGGVATKGQQAWMARTRSGLRYRRNGICGNSRRAWKMAATGRTR